ncbi:hypothetical protein PVAND_000933 [Polypedilum vanderplanki]|uniref:Secreted protein n=1 Tax=Polypedilum vanderplanki TaxID=319348 RepID=A0A9J6BMQ0_POLVA|nr:hypothetical protein PVAND_000933 [Polypedilum vanderplanki]
MARKLILIQIVLIAVLLQNCQAKLKLECLVDFLKFRNVNDDAFASVESYAGNPLTCTDEVKEKIQSFYTNARSKLEQNFRQKPFADCVMKEIESESYENLLLKATAIELKGVGLKFWKISDKNARVKDLEGKAQDIVDGALIKCKGQVDFGAFFDTYYEQKRGEKFNDQFDYCMRKYLNDKSFIKMNQYGFQVNPKYIDTSSVNCDDTMKIAFEQMKSQVSGTGSKPCVIDKFIENGYLDLILKIQLLTKLNPTAAEKQMEKQIFVTQMINMTHAIKTCPM